MRRLSVGLLIMGLFVSTAMGSIQARESEPAYFPPELAALRDADVPAPTGPAPTGPAMFTDLNGDSIQDFLQFTLQQQPAVATVDVIVRLRDGMPAPAVLDSAVAPKARWRLAINGYAATLSPAQILALSQDPRVKMVEADAPVQLFLDTATHWTGVKEARRDFKLTGDGDGDPSRYSRDDVVVAVIDTGIDVRHADLNGSKVIGWYDVVNKLPIAYDDQGHGTHVASIIAGTGRADGKSIGVAPGAALVGIKVMNMLGQGNISNILTGLEWMIENKERFNIRVANLSIGASGCSDGSDAFSEAVNRAVDAGITVLVAAGNSGPLACSIGAPAAAEKVITVGAAYDPGEGGWMVAEFSSRGPTQDGRIKPDILTPGFNINAAKANSGKEYIAQSGTSMATPFAAGVAALALAANPDLNPAGVKARLTDPVVLKDFGAEGPDPEFGRGILQVYPVLQQLTGKRGSFSDGFRHSTFTGNLTYMGYAQTWPFKVSDARRPVAVTMIHSDWTHVKLGLGVPAFQLSVLDPRGKIVAKSRKWMRQEQVTFDPKRRGTYTIRVQSFYGTGGYTLDVSYR